MLFSNCLKTALVAFGLWIAYGKLFQVDGPILDNWNNSEEIVVPRRSYYRAEMCSSLSCRNANDKCRHTQQNAVHHVPDFYGKQHHDLSYCIYAICCMLVPRMFVERHTVCSTSMWPWIWTIQTLAKNIFILDLCDLFFCYDASKKCVY